MLSELPPEEEEKRREDEKMAMEERRKSQNFHQSLHAAPNWQSFSLSNFSVTIFVVLLLPGRISCSVKVTISVAIYHFFYKFQLELTELCFLEALRKLLRSV